MTQEGADAGNLFLFEAGKYGYEGGMGSRLAFESSLVGLRALLVIGVILIFH